MRCYISILLLIASIILAISGCQQSQGETQHGSLNYDLVRTGEINIELDYETTFDARGPAISEDRMYFYNGPNNTIKVYDKETLKLKKTISIEKEGPNSVISPMGITTINNKVGLYEFYSQTIKILDDNGNVIDSVNTSNELLSRSGTLITAMSPILSFDNFVFTTSQGNHLPNRTVYHGEQTIKKTNIEDGSKSTFLSYPDNYINPISGGKQSIIAITLNDKTKSIIASFPLDHNLYELTVDDQILEHPSEPIVFGEFEDHYFRSANSIQNSDWIDIKEKFWNSYSYWAIIYDKYRDVYIRFINVPIPSSVDLENSSIAEQSVRKYQAIIYDKSFNQIGISQELSGLDLTMQRAKFFINENGLHVFAADQKNEDLMRFITFNLVSK